MRRILCWFGLHDWAEEYGERIWDVWEGRAFAGQVSYHECSVCGKARVNDVVALAEGYSGSEVPVFRKTLIEAQIQEWAAARTEGGA